jgi:hypothetical protein
MNKMGQYLCSEDQKVREREAIENSLAEVADRKGGNSDGSVKAEGMTGCYKYCKFS